MCLIAFYLSLHCSRVPLRAHPLPFHTIKKFSQKFQIVIISPGSTSRLCTVIIDSSAANTLSDADYSGISSPVLSSHDNDDIPIDPSLINDFIKINESTTQPSNSLNFRGPPSVMKLKEIEYDVIKKSPNKREDTLWIWEKEYYLKNRLDTDTKLI